MKLITTKNKINLLCIALLFLNITIVLLFYILYSGVTFITTPVIISITPVII